MDDDKVGGCGWNGVLLAVLLLAALTAGCTV